MRGGWDQRFQAVRHGDVAVNEGLGGYETSSESDVEFARVGFTGEDNSGFLRLPFGVDVAFAAGKREPVFEGEADAVDWRLGCFPVLGSNPWHPN